MDLRNEVLAECGKLGADMAGIAPVERFKNAPLRMSPSGLLPSARSVIVAGIHHPDACIELSGEPSPHDIGSYTVQGTMNSKLDDISFLMAKFLEKKGYAAIPVAASNIWRYYGYKDLKVNFAPDIVHRYAAVAAGLGEIGWNGLFLTNEYGPRQRVVSIITEAEIAPDPMYAGPGTCDRCMACVRACPTDAFRKEVKGENRLEIGGKTFVFPDTNKWRCSWAENFQLSLEHEIPDRVDEETCLEYLEKFGPRGGEFGSCLRFCMSPEKRYYDKAYSRAPRRKKEILPAGEEEMSSRIEGICRDGCVDVFAVSGKDLIDENTPLRPELHLPDVRSVISIGARVNRAWKGNSQVLGSVNRMLDYASFEISRYLDASGHSAACGTRLNDNAAARASGTAREDFLYRTVLTSAVLPKAGKETGKTRAIRLDRGGVKDICLEAGCDMAGIFSAGRFDELLNSGVFEAGSREKCELMDEGLMYGPFLPGIKRENFRILRPSDWLGSARSVIVAGLHFPDAPLDCAKVTPSETVGPYAFTSYESLNLLKEVAIRIIRRLGDSGAEAVFTEDLSGAASKTASSRGRLPDLRSNMYEAVLAGLAYPGTHGYPITPDFGIRQRFIAIVTDIPLGSDPVYKGGQLCGSCPGHCVRSCPSGAIGKPGGFFKIEGTEFIKPAIDGFACDWSKMYSMSGREGAEYCGLEVDEPVPSERTPEAAAKKIASVKWGMQKRHVNIAEECLRVCPAGKNREAKNA